MFSIVHYVVRATHYFEDIGKGVLNIVGGISLIKEAEEERDILCWFVAKGKNCLLVIRAISRWFRESYG